MEFLYVCHFSNGHIKIGRSINPASRIAQHADRVAVVGVELVNSETFPIRWAAHSAESQLIDRCRVACESRFANEWFSGLSFLEVLRWADECAKGDIRNFKTRWARLITELRDAGFSQIDVAKATGVHKNTVSRLALGQQEDPFYSDGEKLIEFHALHVRAA